MIKLPEVQKPAREFSYGLDLSRLILWQELPKNPFLLEQILQINYFFHKISFFKTGKNTVYLNENKK